MARKRTRPTSPPDYVFISVVGLLILFGLVMLSSASSDLATVEFGNSYYYLTHQLIYGVIVGVVGFLVGALMYYQKWRTASHILLLINIVALILVFTPLGLNAKGASRWIDIGGFSFQPGELIKLTFLIYIASWLSKGKSRIKSFKEGLFPFLILLGTVLALLVLQPATSTAVILFLASLMMYFASGARFSFIVTIILLAAVLFAALTYITPYRMERILTFLNPEADSLGSGYHITQSLIAIGSGEITGVGYGQSTTKLHYLPEPIGDSIFAVIAEELGFIGATILLLLFLMFIWRGFAIAKKVPDTFGQLVVIGFVSVIGLQTFINIGATSGLLPMTGVPLPFISYGGTALAVFLTMSGIVVNISRYRR